MTAPAGMTRFNLEDVCRANDEWGCNCGPAAVAAIMDMTLDDARPHMSDFEAKGYTNPTTMFAALKNIGRPWREIGPRDHTVGRPWPTYGLARIQWEGPWTKPGVPMRARYRSTHWVGSASREDGAIGVFDVNAIGNGSGWVSLKDWARIVVPSILETFKRADGKWYITHAIEVERR